VFHNRTVKKMCGSMRGVVTRGCRELYSEELRGLYCARNISHSFRSVSCDKATRLPKAVLQRVRSSASIFQEYVVSARSSSSCSPLLLCLPVISILPFIFPSITCFRRQNVTNTISLYLYCMHDIPVLFDFM
jgi:hypothetical protein